MECNMWIERMIHGPCCQFSLVYNLVYIFLFLHSWSKLYLYFYGSQVVVIEGTVYHLSLYTDPKMEITGNPMSFELFLLLLKGNSDGDSLHREKTYKVSHVF